MNMLEVHHLNVTDSRTGRVILPGSSFRIGQGRCLAIAGESGSGKSLTCKALMRLLPAGLRQSGDIWLGGINLAGLSEPAMRQVRGKRLCLIVQNGMRAFEPSRPVGVHLQQTLAWHFGWSRDETTARMRAAMESVMLKDPIAVMNSYPHQLSGGMLQRVMIALSLVLEPAVVIADEPTTALDAVSRFEVAEQLIRMRERVGCSMLFVSHDLGVIRRIADEVLVMKDGEIVESGATESLFAHPRHEYTRLLTGAHQALNRNYITTMLGGAGIAHGEPGS